MLKLELALRKMELASPDFKVALTHWAAFEETIEGEPKELYVLLGSSKLGDTIEQIPVHLVLSGHAHHGSRGIKKARGKFPACNISYKVNEKQIALFDFLPNKSISLRYIKNH